MFNFFRSMFHFVFPVNSFNQQCIKESSTSYLINRNKNISVNIGQSWRLPLDEVDKYCSPIFIKIVDVKNDTVFFTSNYNDEVQETSIDKLKRENVFVS